MGGLSGTYRPTNAHSGKALDVAGPSTDDGANVHQWVPLDKPSQHWRLESV